MMITDWRISYSWTWEERRPDNVRENNGMYDDVTDSDDGDDVQMRQEAKEFLSVCYCVSSVVSSDESVVLSPLSLFRNYSSL